MKLSTKILLVLALVMCVLPSDLFGYENPLFNQWKYRDMQQTFDHIEKVTTVQASSTGVVCPTDIVSTNTAAVYYLPTAGTFNYPIELEVQNLTATVINYDIYSTEAGTGVNVPVVTDPILMDVTGASCVSSKHAKFIFYQEPNICFSAATAATATFIIRTISR